jgi:hypothetical protein
MPRNLLAMRPEGLEESRLFFFVSYEDFCCQLAETRDPLPLKIALQLGKAPGSISVGLKRVVRFLVNEKSFYSLVYAPLGLVILHRTSPLDGNAGGRRADRRFQLGCKSEWWKDIDVPAEPGYA